MSTNNSFSGAANQDPAKAIAKTADRYGNSSNSNNRSSNNTKNKSQDPLRLPPHSLEAEQAVLGGLFLDSEAWDRIAGKISLEDFYRNEHRIIFQIMHSLVKRGQPFDVLTVTEALKSVDQLENAGGEVYLFELSNNIPSVANIISYAEIVREKSVLRQLIGIATDIADSAYHPNGREVAELLDTAESKVFAIAEQTAQEGGPQAVKDVLTVTVEKIDKLYHAGSAITGVATGFADLDHMTSGLQESDLVIVAARPSMGKTSFAMNLVENVATKHDLPVLVFSLEMPSDALAMRMLSSLGRIDAHRLRTGKLEDHDWPRITDAVSNLSQAKLFIDDTPGISPTEMRARARRIVKEHGKLGMIMIDYLQLMQIPGYKVENRVAEISEISRSLKALAKELKVPVIALSQLNRSLEQRSDRRPVMSDIRESGAIEQDADVILFIYRDEVYNENSPDKGVAEIIIGKQRNGPIGKVKLAFQNQFTRFENLAHKSYMQPGAIPGGVNIADSANTHSSYNASYAPAASSSPSFGSGGYEPTTPMQALQKGSQNNPSGNNGS